MAALISLVNKNIGLGFGTVTGTSCLRYESAYESLQFLGLLVLNRVEPRIPSIAPPRLYATFTSFNSGTSTRLVDLIYLIVSKYLAIMPSRLPWLHLHAADPWPADNRWPSAFLAQFHVSGFILFEGFRFITRPTISGSRIHSYINILKHRPFVELPIMDNRLLMEILHPLFPNITLRVTVTQQLKAK